MRTPLLVASLVLFAPLAAAQSVVPGDPGAIAPPKAEPPAGRATAGAPVEAKATGSRGIHVLDGTIVEEPPAFGAADLTTPVGLWRTIDDQTGRPRSLVRIVDSGDGVLVGRVEKILDPAFDRPDAVCERCDDDRRNQPIIGLEIIRGLKPHGRSWADGKILNPEDGKIYHLKATPAEAGTKLEMRGYIGLPIFGRSQTWIREP